MNNKRQLEDPKFGRFAIARITDDYLKGKDDDLLRYHLWLFLQIRYATIPKHEGKDLGPESEYAKKINKYMRDINTERGRINCIAREIPCDCMEEKRIEAQSMEKVTPCFGCEAIFSKEKMLRCDYVQYCSKDCSIKHWPKHKAFCRK
mmetsp:Transcript_5723/g.6170  ORF Transcript_5723/g.6170 Transcript_5723/m.6170 type:complete len:148 (-) Transcript_5723:106-549(-)